MSDSKRRQTVLNAWDAWFAPRTKKFENALESVLVPGSERPQSIHRAMRYSVFPAGKRIRPALTLLGYESTGGRGQAGLLTGAAVELIHTFSLIHDDLPCMDDDDLRRGRPTCHVKFGEATAVLAGDALQILAFDVLARMRVDAELRVEVLGRITRAVGTGGVIGGQVVDIESEGKKISRQTLEWMHARKTGALLECAICSGAVLGSKSRRGLGGFQRFGQSFGLLFQIVDDVLNEVGSYKALGRHKGGDREKGKATYPSTLGLAKTREVLIETVHECRDRVPVDGPRRDVFLGLIEFVLSRLPSDWQVEMPEDAPRAGGVPR